MPSTSWKSEYRLLVVSTLPVLCRMGVSLIPSLELMLAYENKLVQTRLDKCLGLSMPVSFCVSTFESLVKSVELVGYPFVLKMWKDLHQKVFA